MPKKPAAPDPDRFRREQAGTYRTEDGRFIVRSDAGGAWYVTDTERTNDFGLELVVGPFGTLDGAKEAALARREDPTGRPLDDHDDAPEEPADDADAADDEHAADDAEAVDEPAGADEAEAEDEPAGADGPAEGEPPEDDRAEDEPARTTRARRHLRVVRDRSEESTDTPEPASAARTPGRSAKRSPAAKGRAAKDRPAEPPRPEEPAGASARSPQPDADAERDEAATRASASSEEAPWPVIRLARRRPTGDERDAVARTVRAISEAWTSGDPGRMADLLHADVEIVAPDFAERVQGPDRVIATFRDFVRVARLHAYAESELVIRVWGPTAVATFRYDIDWELEGERTRETGHDTYVLVGGSGSWSVTWRLLVPSAEPPD